MKIEEEIFTKNNNNQFNAIINRNSRHDKDFGKNINSVKIKKKDIININIKESDKKRNSVRIKNSHNHNINEHNQNNLVMEKERKMLKRFSIKLQSIRSQANNKKYHNLLYQSIRKSKKRANSIIERYKSINANR